MARTYTDSFIKGSSRVPGRIEAEPSYCLSIEEMNSGKHDRLKKEQTNPRFPRTVRSMHDLSERGRIEDRQIRMDVTEVVTDDLVAKIRGWNLQRASCAQVISINRSQTLWKRSNEIRETSCVEMLKAR